MSRIKRLAKKIVKEMGRIDDGASDGDKLRKLTREYIAAQKKIDRMGSVVR